MAINYHPELGEALWCEYDNLDPQGGEMKKRRLVVVLSPKSAQRHRLVTVVPISATEPETLKSWHIKLERDPYPKGTEPDLWVKCDMINVVSFDRLSGYHYRWGGRRVYQKMKVSLLELIAIREGVLKGLGLHGWDPAKALETLAPRA